MPDEKIHLTDAEWRERLTPEQYAVLRQGGTERAFSGQYEKNKAAGEYVCAGCGQPLFESDDKFDSGSGWPSFVKPAEDGAVDEHPHRSHLREVRRPSRARVSRRPGGPRRHALLHQQRRARVQARG
jgi:methionine-R-sulfoxide reductase